ncbi:MAG TPA: hypothetical protein VLE48_04415 [Terriglobales bacterium]|nr:hypothetical protein [Terriglobales bacterium]
MPKHCENVSSRFNDLDLHDSKLLGVHLVRDASERVDDVVLDIRLRPQQGESAWRDVQLRFRDCTILKMNLDLDGKRVCADDIATNLCSSDSPLREELERGQLKYEKEPLADYLLFQIQLIHPGGEIDLFARDFELQQTANPMVPEGS